MTKVLPAFIVLIALTLACGEVNSSEHPKNVWEFTGSYSTSVSGECDQVKFEITDKKMIITRGEEIIENNFTEYKSYVRTSGDMKGQTLEVGKYLVAGSHFNIVLFEVPETLKPPYYADTDMLQIDFYETESFATDEMFKTLTLDQEPVASGSLFPCR